MRTRSYLKRYGKLLVKPKASALLATFHRLNRDVFDGAIPEPERIVPIHDGKADKWLAFASLHDDGSWDLGFTDSKMTVNSAYDLVAHEMVHAYLWTVEGDRKTDHGSPFMAWAPALALHGIVLMEKLYSTDH